MKHNQSGFTLIEIAIVLVIIGLLLGGVLKGQELINSAKVKNLGADFKNVPLFIYGYQDKFRALPGDDPSVNTHIGASCTTLPLTSCVAAAGIHGNGIIEGTWNDNALAATPSTEAYAFWMHVRFAGLAAGATDTTTIDIRPTNAAGGRIGMQGGTTPSISNLRGSYIVCSDGILGKFAKQLDIQMDDGNTATGSMMTAARAAGVSLVDGITATAPVGTPTDEDSYTVCMGV